MEEIQRYSIKVNSETNEILGMGLSDRITEEDGTSIYAVSWPILEPFYNQSKHHRKYLPVIINNTVKKFKLKEEFELDIVVNTDEPIVKSLRSYENFIVECRVQVQQEIDKITLRYDTTLFDDFTNEENLERLNNVRDRVYNMYITRRGDPYTIFDRYSTTLNNLIDGKIIEIPYIGEQEISVYAIT